MNTFSHYFRFYNLKAVVKRAFTSNKLAYILAIVAIICTLPSLRTGLCSDDYFQREVLTGNHEDLGMSSLPDSMYEFFDGNPEHIKERMEKGSAVWWTYENLKISFFRPLTELTHRLDYHLWPQSTLFMHAHNLLWYGLLVMLVTFLYRTVMSDAWLAGLAAVLYALDDAHGVPVGWIANRSALIATFLGVVTLLVHIRWRRLEYRHGAILGAVLFLISLLSAEYAVATLCYLFAYELFLVDKTWKNKLKALLPYLSIAFAWWVMHHYSGYGAVGSGAYLDPTGESGRYLAALYKRIPLLLYSQWYYPNAFFYHLLPTKALPIAWSVVIVLLAGLIVFVIPLLKRDRIARFWATGMMLSLLPIAAMHPGNRLLFFTGVGAMGLLSQLLSGWFSRASWLSDSRKWRFSSRIVVILFILIHCIIGPLTLSERSTSLYKTTKSHATDAVLQLPDDIHLEGKTAVLVNPPIPIFITDTFFSARKTMGLRPPDKLRILASGMQSRIEITRIHPNTIDVQIDNGFLARHFDKVFRSPEHPFRQGEQIDLSGMVATVISLTEDDRPLKVRFTFEKPLQNDDYCFLKWHHGRLVRFEPPDIGQSVSLPPV